jgi:hypothetical protein
MLNTQALFYALVLFLNKSVQINNNTPISKTERLIQMQINQPKGVKRKIKRRKLKSGVKWQGTLKEKGVKQTGGNQGHGVHCLSRSDPMCLLCMSI